MEKYHQELFRETENTVLEAAERLQITQQEYCEEMLNIINKNVSKVGAVLPDYYAQKILLDPSSEKKVLEEFERAVA